MRKSHQDLPDWTVRKRPGTPIPDRQIPWFKMTVLFLLVMYILFYL